MIDVDTRRLTDADVPAAMDLVRQAGWNQVPADWHRLLELEPAGCFGGYVGSELVATATLLTYDGIDRVPAEPNPHNDGPAATDVGWVGMVLVDKNHRRNGYGGTIVNRVLEAAADRDVALGLDATDAGRPLYRRRGFVDVCPIERWAGTPTTDRVLRESDGSGDSMTFEIDSTTIDAVCTFDRQACGVDRGDLLRQLLDLSDVFGVGTRDADGIRGYAVARPGREFGQVGPIVASRPDHVGPLLVRATEKLAQDAVLVDLLAVDAVDAVLECLGLECQRRLTRMTAPEPKRLLVGPDVVAAAGFEFG